MIAGRRMRRRPLIRTSTMKSVIARNMTVGDSLIRHRHVPGSARLDGKDKYADGPSLDSVKRKQASPPSTSLPLSSYLQQLSTLYSAGVLTDEEFSSAKARLIGS